MRVTRKNHETVYSAIRQLHWLGKTSAEAAASLGMKVQALNRHRLQIGLAPFEQPQRMNTRKDAWTAQEDAQLSDAIDTGLSASETAELIGRSVNGVETRRSRLDLPHFKRRPSKNPRKNRVWTPDRIRQLAELRARGLSFRRCAPKLQATSGSIAGACDRYLKQERVPA